MGWKTKSEKQKKNTRKKHTQQLLFLHCLLFKYTIVSFCFDNEHQERRKTMKNFGDYKYLKIGIFYIYIALFFVVSCTEPLWPDRRVIERESARRFVWIVRGRCFLIEIFVRMRCVLEWLKMFTHARQNIAKPIFLNCSMEKYK